uniref:Uncharacterized protein n=1 Tax=Anguilla anguilla TaxID=7936 RepID=A0A0E9SRW2_ANGAN
MFYYYLFCLKRFLLGNCTFYPLLKANSCYLAISLTDCKITLDIAAKKFKAVPPFPAFLCSTVCKGNMFCPHLFEHVCTKEENASMGS